MRSCINLHIILSLTGSVKLQANKHSSCSSINLAHYSLGTFHWKHSKAVLCVTCIIFFFYRLSQEKFSDAESKGIDWLELAKAVQQQAGEFFPSHILQSFFISLLRFIFIVICELMPNLLMLNSNSFRYCRISTKRTIKGLC